MKIGIIGLGLIGGSIARELKVRGLGTIVVYGVESNALHAQKALDLGLVHQLISLDDAIENCDVIITAIPVNSIENMLPYLLDDLRDDQVVIDTGSTKAGICRAADQTKNRRRFVAAHPLAGTEFSGPEAAIMDLFKGKKNIICDEHKTDKDALDLALKIFEFLGMQTYFLSPDAHDKHVAYVSHLSHISSFTLSQTVLDIEEDEKQIFNLASTGFASTVRLAKSNPDTWTPIFENNAKYLVEALDRYISYLDKFRQAIRDGQTETIKNDIKKANTIKHVLDGIHLNEEKTIDKK